MRSESKSSTAIPAEIEGNWNWNEIIRKPSYWQQKGRLKASLFYSTFLDLNALLYKVHLPD